MTNLRWERDVLPRAREIVDSYDTGVTLRQLFYRLVSDRTVLLPNTQSKYIYLSRITAEGRRDGTFPDLLDRRSRIMRYRSFDDPAEAIDYALRIYRRDRTEGQEWNIYLGLEKAGLIEQIDSWFGLPLGVPVLPLGGIASQSFCDRVRRDITIDGRPALLIYVGDFDPTGDFLDLDFEKRVGNFERIERIGLSEAQVRKYKLAENTDPAVAKKLEDDPRKSMFIKRHKKFLDRYYGGRLVQFEIDALAPETLRELFQDAIDGYWDTDAYQASRTQEAKDRARLREISDNLGDSEDEDPGE
jgi:hypothetical protein